jgi:hypothetical protein
MTTHQSARFLVLHGWQNRRPQQHWQWQMVEALRQDGRQVLYPQLPDPDQPSLERWSDLVRAELAQLGTGERVVIAHSLAVSLWLNLAPQLSSDEHVDRVLLVSPPSPEVLRKYPEVAAFVEAPHDARAVKAAAKSTRLVYSDNDPFCPEGAHVAFGALDLDADLIPGGQHLTPDSGYGTWPAMFEWCRDPRVRLTPRMPGL